MLALRLMLWLPGTMELLYWQRGATTETESCLWTTVQIRILNTHVLYPILRNFGRKINSIMFTLFHRRFHYGSVSILFYALVSFTSTITTVDHSSTKTSRIASDFDAAIPQKEKFIFEKRYIELKDLLNVEKFDRQ